MLMQYQLDDITRNAVDSVDSAQIADAYIRHWAEDVLFYEKATTDKNQQIETMVEQYRRELYLHNYEEKLVQQRMNKEIQPAEIEAFYEANGDLFLLDVPILQGLLLVVPNGTPDIPKLRRWMAKPMDEIENIEKYAYTYATGYELFTDRWRTGDEVIMHIPLTQQEFVKQLSHNKQIEVSDTAQTYILEVTAVRMAGEKIPLDYAEPAIKNILLKERETAFIRAQKSALYKEADMLFRIKRK